MNIFACHESPFQAAMALPDKHIVKMPLETAQMLAVAFGQHGLDLGTLRKADGTPYADTAFRNHPCTVWVRKSFANLAWTIAHGQALCWEYTHRYGKRHACLTAMGDADELYRQCGFGLGIYDMHDTFVRAMPDDIKNDASINEVTAYRRYLQTKTWAKWDKDPSRKPEWWS